MDPRVQCRSSPVWIGVAIGYNNINTSSILYSKCSSVPDVSSIIAVMVVFVYPRIPKASLSEYFAPMMGHDRIPLPVDGVTTLALSTTVCAG